MTSGRKDMRLSLCLDRSLQVTHPAQERLAPPLGSTSRTLFMIADKLVPAIKDNLMDENGRDQSVSISHN